jgi:ATP-binding cassette subfamily C (CFTR/MRP) protein 4
VSEFRILQAILMGRVISYFTPGNGMTKTEGRIYGGVLVSIIFIRLAFDHHYSYLTFVLGMRVRTACCSLLYRKVSSLEMCHNETQ